MKLKDLKHLTQEQIIELSFDDEVIDAISCDKDISIHQVHGELLVKQGELLFSVDNPEVLDNYGEIEHFLWLPIAVKKNTLLLQTIPCMPNAMDFETLQASIDEKIVEQVSKKANIANANVEQVASWLQEEFILKLNNTAKLLFATNNSNKVSANIFTLVGKTSLLQIEFTKDDKVWVKSIKTRPRNNKLNLTVLETELTFVDYTVAARIQDPLMRAKLEELNKDNSTYINLWNQYNLKVKEKAVALATKAGFVRYIKVDKENSVDGIKWKFYFKEKDLEKVNMLKAVLQEESGQTLDINKILPSWLENNIGDIALEKDEKVPSISAKLVNNTNQFITLNLTSEGRPEDKGVIYLSISGSIVQMQRREQARDAITKLTNPMKDLRFLIEDRDITISTQRKSSNTLEALTASARSSFKGKPTAKQEEALFVALNTPDIALILGPPGTGKTQVISALQNRLAEEHKSNMTGQILLTSFQNDAVDNVVARSEAFGIPAIRADDNIRAPFLLEQWSKKQSSQLNEVASNLSETEGSYKIVKNIRQDIAALLDTRVAKEQKKERVNSLLEDIEHLRIHHGFDIPQALKIKIEQHFIGQRADTTFVDNVSLIKQVRGLRVTPTSYSDDGFEQTFTCLSALKRTQKYLAEVEFLELISNKIDLSKADFSKLKVLKNKLLDELIPDYRPKILQVALSKEDISILHQLEQAISAHSSKCLAGIPDVIEEYLDLIKYQPEYLAQSVKQYTTSVGASCQRSAGDRVVRYKSQVNSALNEVTSEFSFDTVIVDEAARANPLDLFIPMALASKRIVLVGDHFQLPQMLEPDIEKEMIDAGELELETSNAIKMSLFERLYTQLKEREAKDGIQRTVMLDTQFRMHQDLGDFISRSFYESEGEPKLMAGLGDDKFDLGIPKYKGKVAEWVDLPLSSGREKRSGTSWKRECEALKVVEEVRSLFEEKPNLSIGVITFFSAQRDLILDKLSQVGACHKSNDGWEYLPGYKTTEEGEEKLRVGSVDAFQGKEFDVVILSTVRSNDLGCSDENSYRKKYGFIRTPNRLNVAFSRAKSLIKVVGDKNMFAGEHAKKAIPQVWSFIHDLCEVK